MTMSIMWNPRTVGVALLAGLAALVLVVEPVGMVGAAQSRREAEGARLLRGSLDLHVHMDPRTPGAGTGSDRADLSTVRLARARGMRGLLKRDHPVLIVETGSQETVSLLGGLDYTVERLPGSSNLLCRPRITKPT